MKMPVCVSCKNKSERIKKLEEVVCRKRKVISELLMALERECVKDNPNQFWVIPAKNKKLLKVVRLAQKELGVTDD